MAYYTGLINSYEDLKLALHNGLSANGWTITGDIVHKGNLYFLIEHSEATLGGLYIRGGTGILEGALDGQGPIRTRLGRFRTNLPTPIWPAPYFLMIFTDPDEVYLFHRYTDDMYSWLSFGQTNLPVGGTGAWYSGQCFNGASSDYGGARQPCNMSPDSGGRNYQTSWAEYYPAGGMFWHTDGTDSRLSDSYRTEAMHIDLGAGPTWVRGGEFNAIRTAMPHMRLLPNAWNMESVLLPIQAVIPRGSSKNSMISNIENARYCRIDNHDPEQVISIGGEQWKIFPWVRKFMSMRDGPSESLNSFDDVGSHSGTMGVAIRYDGA